MYFNRGIDFRCPLFIPSMNMPSKQRRLYDIRLLCFWFCGTSAFTEETGITVKSIKLFWFQSVGTLILQNLFFQQPVSIFKTLIIFVMPIHPFVLVIIIRKSMRENHLTINEISTGISIHLQIASVLMLH